MRHLISTLAVTTTLAASALAVPGPADAAAKPHWRVTISANRVETTVGKKVVFTGKVGKAAAGKLVVLQERRAGGTTWGTQRNALIHRDGTYSTSDTPTTNKRRSYKRQGAEKQKDAAPIQKPQCCSFCEWLPAR